MIARLRAWAIAGLLAVSFWCFWSGAAVVRVRPFTDRQWNLLGFSGLAAAAWVVQTTRPRPH